MPPADGYAGIGAQCSDYRSQYEGSAHHALVIMEGANRASAPALDVGRWRYQSEALALALYKPSVIRVEIVKPPLARSGFQLQAKRWIVERTFAW